MKDFLDLITLAFSREVLKRLVFSRPIEDAPKKASGRLCAHRGKRLLAVEYSLSSGTVSQKNIKEEELPLYLTCEAVRYRQINLITSVGDAELKYSKAGEPILLGADKLKRKLSGNIQLFALQPEGLDRVKRHILSGKEDFLIKLGISSKDGRVHDKRQGKFRQINRFLEYIEEIYPELPQEGELRIFDLCCGKSYLSFAAYYYLTEIKKRRVYMLGIDLKADVMDFCNGMARDMGFTGMNFITDNIENTPSDIPPHMVISLHACDVATDIVLMNAVRLGAKIILSTPCCHKKMSDVISCDSLGFVTKYPKLRGKLAEALTDAVRLEYLAAHGYEVNATELTDPDDTPKNTLLRAVLRREASREALLEYRSLLKFLIGEGYEDYPLI